jgi:hypothetical protein
MDHPDTKDFTLAVIDAIREKYKGSEAIRRGYLLNQLINTKSRKNQLCLKMARLVDEDIPEFANPSLKITISTLLSHLDKSVPLPIDYAGDMIDWIHVNMPITTSINFDADVDIMDKFVTISGDVQSGKTKAMRYCMLKNKLAGRKSLLIVRNIKDDVHQFITGTLLFNKDLRNTSFRDEYNIIAETLTGLAAWMNPQSNIDTLIVLANGRQLHKVNEALKLRKIGFSIFMDEADMIVNSVRTDTSKYNLRNQLDYLVEYAQRVMCVTATSLGLFFKEGYQIRSKNILTLKHPPHYKGIDQLHFSEVIMKSKKKAIDIFSEEFIKIVKSKDTLVFKNAIQKGSEMEDHPVVLLNKTSNLNKDQLAMLYPIINSPELKKKWAYIVYNRHGIQIFHHSFGGKVVQIAGVKGKTSGNGLLSFLHIGIQDCLQYLKDNGGVDRFGYIIISAGFLAARGINYCSRDFEWHLTGEFLVRPKSSYSEDLMQSLRLCGIYKDNIPLTLWTTKDVWDDILKTLSLRQNIILDMVKKDGVLEDMLDEYRVVRKDMPKRKITKPKHTFKIIAHVTTDISEEELEKQGLEKLAKSLARKSGKSTNLRDLITYCSRDPNKIFTSEEIYNNTNIKYINDFTRWELTTHNRYKILCLVTEGNYKINPNVHL